MTAASGKRPFELLYGVQVPQSATYVVEGEPKGFSTFDDYLGALQAVGKVESAEELLADAQILAGIFHDWVRQGQTGCRFARRLSRDPTNSGWHTIAWLRGPDEPGLPEELQVALHAAYMHQAVLLLLPQVNSANDYAVFAANLCESDYWTWEIVETDPDTPERSCADSDTDHVVVGLRWHGPDSKKPSWPLAFGPLDCFPVTRRAPVSALALRTVSPLASSEGIDLAAMDSGLSEPAFAKFKMGSAIDKQALLDGELLHAARARSTLRLPRDVVDEHLSAE